VSENKKMYERKRLGCERLLLPMATLSVEAETNPRKWRRKGFIYFIQKQKWA